MTDDPTTFNVVAEQLVFISNFESRRCIDSKRRRRPRVMELCGRMEAYLPHLVMTLCFLALAVFIVFLQGLISDGSIRPLVFVFYEHLVSTVLLSTLALICERKKRPALTLNVLLWAFLIGFLQIPVGQLLLTSSLRYVSATFQTTAMNTVSAATLLVAVILRREILSFRTINGQAKFWGIMLSVIGATIMVLWRGPRLGVQSSPSNFGDRAIGFLMVMSALFGGVFASIAVEHVTVEYPAEMSLSAIMSFSGTMQTAIITGLTENTSAWKISFKDSYEVPVILYGGIFVTGLSYYARTWCVHKKGPVFTYAFSPVLIVVTFILETLVLKKDARLGSVVGAVFVLGGVYLLLWAKADDYKEKLIRNCSVEDGSYEQLS